MKLKSIYGYIAGFVIVLSPVLALADGNLTASCAGVPTTSSVMWTASSTGGVAPVAFLWSNGATTTVQTVSEIPGTYSMNIQATDASSTVATSTCSAIVPQPTNTGTDYQTQIQNLLNQIAALRAQLQALIQQNGGNGSGYGTTTPPVLPPPTLGSCLKFNRDLKRGDDGDDVRALQQTLASENPTVFSSSSITGYFGQQTENALKNFQWNHGILTGTSTTGYFGPRTRGFIQGHCAGGLGNPNASTTRPFQLNWNNGQDDRGNGHGNGNGKGN